VAQSRRQHIQLETSRRELPSYGPYSCRLSGEGVAAATVGALEATSCALDMHGAMRGVAGKGQCTMGACA
tara:strand:- start:261 stop:470 length:210 start_codon:yes stop_codon:yes gene_type:complete